MTDERAVQLRWTGRDVEFSGGGTMPETPAITIDGDGKKGPSPMLALLLAAAGCSGADVVLILRKMRVELTTLEIAVRGVRRQDDPRRYVEVTFAFRMGGEGLDRAKAERAVELSLGTYCSVVHSLRQDITVRHEITLA